MKTLGYLDFTAILKYNLLFFRITKKIKQMAYKKLILNFKMLTLDQYNFSIVYRI